MHYIDISDERRGDSSVVSRVDIRGVLRVSIGTILLIILILLLIGALPTWPYATGWGYYPSGGLGLVLVIVLVLVLIGRI